MKTLTDPMFWVVGTSVVAWFAVLVFWGPKLPFFAGFSAAMVSLIGGLISLDVTHPVVFAFGSWLTQGGFFLFYAAYSVGRRKFGRGKIDRLMWLSGGVTVALGLGLQTLYMASQMADGNLISLLREALPLWILLALFHLVGGWVFTEGLRMVVEVKRELDPVEWTKDVELVKEGLSDDGVDQ